MDDQAGRLVDDREVVVLVENRQRQVLRGRTCRGGRGDVAREDLPGGPAEGRLGEGLSLEGDVPAGDEVGEKAAAEAREELGEGSVETRFVLMLPDCHRAPLTHAASLYKCSSLNEFKARATISRTQPCLGRKFSGSFRTFATFPGRLSYNSRSIRENGVSGSPFSVVCCENSKQAKGKHMMNLKKFAVAAAITLSAAAAMASNLD